MATTFHILHVDDDALMRDVVELSLGLDPAFVLMSCASGEEALAAVGDWQPDLILCDALMPGMSGPELLKRLRADPATAQIPVVIMSARAQANGVADMTSLGAAAVIAKPFDPEKLADTLRRHLHTIRLNVAGYDFSQRLQRDAATLAALRRRLGEVAVSEELQTFAHKLAGAAGVFNFTAVSAAATALETAIVDVRDGRATPAHVAANFDALLESIAQA